MSDIHVLIHVCHYRHIGHKLELVSGFCKFIPFRSQIQWLSDQVSYMQVEYFSEVIESKVIFLQIDTFQRSSTLTVFFLQINAFQKSETMFSEQLHKDFEEAVDKVRWKRTWHHTPRNIEIVWNCNEAKIRYSFETQISAFIRLRAKTWQVWFRL